MKKLLLATLVLTILGGCSQNKPKTAGSKEQTQSAQDRQWANNMEQGLGRFS